MDAKQSVKKMTCDEQIEIAAPIEADETTANADGSVTIIEKIKYGRRSTRTYVDNNRSSRTGRGAEANLIRAYQATRSKIPAAPMPPPTHIVTIP